MPNDLAPHSTHGIAAHARTTRRLGYSARTWVRNASRRLDCQISRPALRAAVCDSNLDVCHSGDLPRQSGSGEMALVDGLEPTDRRHRRFSIFTLRQTV